VIIQANTASVSNSNAVTCGCGAKAKTYYKSSIKNNYFKIGGVVDIAEEWCG